MSFLSASPPRFAHPPAVRRFGRFALRQLLGRSQRTMLWLADDPRYGQRDAADACRASRRRTPRRSTTGWPRPGTARGCRIRTSPRWSRSGRTSTGRTSSATARSAARSANASPRRRSADHNELAGWVVPGAAAASPSRTRRACRTATCSCTTCCVDERGHVRLMALGAAGQGIGAARAGEPAAVARPVDGPAAPARAARRGRARRARLRRARPPPASPASRRSASPTSRASSRGWRRSGARCCACRGRTPQPVAEAPARDRQSRHPSPVETALSERAQPAACARRLARRGARRQRLARSGCCSSAWRASATCRRCPAWPTPWRAWRAPSQQHTRELAEHVLLDIGLTFELLRQVNTAQVRVTQVAGNGPGADGAPCHRDARPGRRARGGHRSARLARAAGRERARRRCSA